MDERQYVTVEQFSIIYKLTEWLEAEREKRTVREPIEIITGKAKVLRVFGTSKQGTVVGCRIAEGQFKQDETIQIERGSERIGKGKITMIKLGKIEADIARAETECGLLIESTIEFNGSETLIASHFE